MKKSTVIKFVFFLLPVIMGLNACSEKDPADSYKPVFTADTSNQKILVMGFPNFSYGEITVPLIKYLNAHMQGTRIKVRACVDFEEYVRFLNQGKFDITIINGIVSSEAVSHGYSIYGKITSEDPYSSLIITPKNVGITKVMDLKGKKIAMVPSNVIPSTMMGMYYLYENGLDVNLNIHIESVASFEAAILSVYLGKSEAGICPRRNWNVYVRDHPEILSKVEIKWETPPLEHNAVLIKNSVDKKVVSELMRLLFETHDKKDAKAALDRLAITGFEKADNDTYKSMMEFKKKYDAVIF